MSSSGGSSSGSSKSSSSSASSSDGNRGRAAPPGGVTQRPAQPPPVVPTTGGAPVAAVGPSPPLPPQPTPQQTAQPTNVPDSAPPRPQVVVPTYNVGGKKADAELALHMANLVGLSKWTSKLEVHKLLHLIMDRLCGKNPNFSSEFPAESGSGELVDIVNAYSLFYHRAVSLDLLSTNDSRSLLVADLTEVGLSPELTKFVLQTLAGRGDEIKEALREKTTTTISKTHLDDFDWKLNLSMGSDKLATMRKFHLQLQLKLADLSGRQRFVLAELTKEDLDSLLAEMEAINEVVQRLRV